MTLLAVLAIGVACGRESDRGTVTAESLPSVASAEPAPEAAPDDPARPSTVIETGTPRVLFVGTSLTAGLGLSKEEAYPARVAELLESRGMPIEAINAGVSGDTSAGGLARLDWLLRLPPDVVLIELGANDGLRGLPVSMTEVNLTRAATRAREVGARVIVAGMLMPPNYGEDYTRAFAAVFPRVAERTDSILVPFLLDGVAAEADLNQADGIHPNAEGHRRIAATVLPFLLEALGTRSAVGFE